MQKKIILDNNFGLILWANFGLKLWAVKVLIKFSVYPTTTDFFNSTLLEFCPEVAGKIGNFADISSVQQEIYLVNYFLFIFTDFLYVKCLCCA